MTKEEKLLRAVANHLEEVVKDSDIIYEDYGKVCQIWSQDEIEQTKGERSLALYILVHFGIYQYADEKSEEEEENE